MVVMAVNLYFFLNISRTLISKREQLIWFKSQLWHLKKDVLKRIKHIREDTWIKLIVKEKHFFKKMFFDTCQILLIHKYFQKMTYFFLHLFFISELFIFLKCLFSLTLVIHFLEQNIFTNEKKNGANLNSKRLKICTDPMHDIFVLSYDILTFINWSRIVN